MKKHLLGGNRYAVQGADGAMRGSVNLSAPAPSASLGVVRRTHGDRPSLAETHPMIAAELDDPSLAWCLTAGSDRKVGWRCARSHTWDARVYSRTSATRPAGCPKCATARVPLSESHPGLVSELVDPSLGDLLSAGSNRKVMWRCARHHEWKAAISDRTRGKGCPRCPRPCRNPLSESHPGLVSELVDPSLGDLLSAGSNRKVMWRCARHHEWKAKVNDRTGRRPTGCPSCATARVPLSESHPDLVMELVDASLGDTYSAGSHERVEWRCTRSGHTWFAEINTRTRKNPTGCPSCAEYGYKTSEPGSLYLLVDYIQMAATVAQFGISNDAPTRLAKHSRSGFESAPVRLIQGDGQAIADLERRLKREQKTRAIPTAKDDGIEFDGSTEAFILEGPHADDFYAWIVTQLDYFPGEL